MKQRYLVYYGTTCSFFDERKDALRYFDCATVPCLLYALVIPEEPPCSKTSAIWCPNCGTCTCAENLTRNGKGSSRLKKSCPLHGIPTDHPYAHWPKSLDMDPDTG